MGHSGFYTGTAKVGRALVRAYLRIVFRPKVIYSSEESKRLAAKGGVIFASNHVGHNDGQTEQTCLPNSACLIAKDQREKGIVKWITEGDDYISIDRFGLDTQWLREATSSVRKGKNILIFPEGHTSKDGSLDEFKSGFIMLGVMTGATILPVYNDGEYHWLFGRRVRYYVDEPYVLPTEGKGLNAAYLESNSMAVRTRIQRMKEQYSK